MLTLRQWQNTVKPQDLIIYNCSLPDGSDGWIQCPLGMSYQFMQHRDTDMAQYQIGTHDQTVLCAISSDTDARRRRNPKNRKSIIETLQRNGINNTTIDSLDYFKTLPKYKFMVSPEGNGLDCHRHYESLMAGCIPIMERNIQIQDKYRDCPVLWTDDYSEITEAYLESKYQEFLDTSYNFSCLLMPAYDDISQQTIKQFGNWWGNRFTGKSWYL